MRTHFAGEAEDMLSRRSRRRQAERRRLSHSITGRQKAMRIAVLTGWGDCPGLNAVIHAVVKKGIIHYGDEFVGFLEGWRGVLDNNTVALTLEKVDGILDEG